MSSLVQFVKSMRSYLELTRIQLIFLRKKKQQGNHEIKGQRRQLSKIRSMALDILFPAKDYCNRNSKMKFDRSNDIINNKKYEEEKKKKKKIFVCLFGWFLNVLVNY